MCGLLQVVADCATIAIRPEGRTAEAAFGQARVSRSLVDRHSALLSSATTHRQRAGEFVIEIRLR
jgi:hypothetical protein